MTSIYTTVNMEKPFLMDETIANGNRMCSITIQTSDCRMIYDFSVSVSSGYQNADADLLRKGSTDTVEPDDGIKLSRRY